MSYPLAANHQAMPQTVIEPFKRFVARSSLPKAATERRQTVKKIND